MSIFGFGGPEKRKKPLVLVVDDDALLSEMICALLDEIHCDTIRTDDGVEALEIVAEKKPDLVLLDVVMPAMSGVNVLRGIKQNSATKKIPVMMVSGEQKGYDLDTAFRLGAADYIIKPVRKAEFEAKVKAVLSHSGYPVPQ